MAQANEAMRPHVALAFLTAVALAKACSGGASRAGRHQQRRDAFFRNTSSGEKSLMDTTIGQMKTWG